MNGWKMKFLLGWLIFKGYVKLPGSIPNTQLEFAYIRCLEAEFQKYSPKWWFDGDESHGIPIRKKITN